VLVFSFSWPNHLSKHTEQHPRISDIHQSWWQLSFIQLSGFVSLPVLAGSVLILQNSNLASAILTLIVGNILLWLIRLGIVAMSCEGRKSTLDIAREYLGPFGALWIAILVLASAAEWFVVGTTMASNALCRLIHIDEGSVNQFIQIGVLIGIMSMLFCINGMKVLRYTATICFPILVIAFIGGICSDGFSIPQSTHDGISLSGLPIFLATNLGVTADFPTFFRHSQSLRSSFIALTAIQVISFCIGLGALFFGSTILPWLGMSDISALPDESLTTRSLLIILIFLSVICANICSIYSASVGWELVAPIFAGVKEYLILGLGMTIVFVLVADIFSLNTLGALFGCFLVNLSLVFVLAFLLRHYLHHDPKPYEQTTYQIAWLSASLLNTLQFFQVFAPQSPSLLAAFATIVLVIALSFSLHRLIYRYKQQRNHIAHDE